MSKNTKIEWAHDTFNPWVGCTKISPACDHCYAEGWAKRSGQVVWGKDRKRTSIANWKLPLKWDKEAQAAGVRRKVFCASLADVFDNAVPQEWRNDLFRLISETQNLDWLLLTKRIGNVLDMLDEALLQEPRLRNGACRFASWPWPNVWLGATICNQIEADRDIPKLLSLPATKRFLSMEPLLGPVDLSMIQHTVGYGCGPCTGCGSAVYIDALTGSYFCAASCDGPVRPAIDWVIVGGESGPGARPMHPDWARSLRDQCLAAGVPFLFKQWGEWAPALAIDESDERVLQERWIRRDGLTVGKDDIQFFHGDEVVYRAGKKAAGRLLDDRTWNGVPA
ncbi:MAG: phage Gp37/Gp68 family protein [Rhodoferax sp.]|nr:phage Gp37/Gp68 family protein [Rhodoferax sp.]